MAKAAQDRKLKAAFDKHHADFVNGYLLFRAPALVGAHSLFMGFGDGLAPPIRI